MTELLTKDEVAVRLAVSVRTVQRLTARGELAAVYPARWPRYTERALDAYVARLEQRRRRRVA